MAKKQFSIQVDDSMYEEIEALAAERSKSRSAVCVDLIASGLRIGNVVREFEAATGVKFQRQP